MKAFQKIGFKIGRKILERKIKNHKRNIKFYDFETAQKINILFDAQDKENFNEAKNFINHLSEKGKTVNALGFVDDKNTIESVIFKKGVNFFSVNNLNWFGKPENSSVNDFINDQVDILINLNINSNKSCYPLEYIVALSKASFKISALSEHHHADLTIDVSKNSTVKYYIEQITNYLKMLGKNQD